MFVFKATQDGGLDPGSDYNRSRFKDWLKKHVGLKVRIELDEPESRNLRRYFEGALVPAVCEHLEWCDPKSADDLVACREMLKQEFNGRYVPTLEGGHTKVAMSSKGQKALRRIVNGVTDWMPEAGIPIPNHELYKKWRDSGRLVSDPDFPDWLNEQGLQSDGTPLVG